VNKLSEYSEKKDKHIAGGPGKKSTSKLLLLCGEVATKLKIYESHLSDNWPPGAEDASRNDDEMTDPEKRILGFSVFAHVAKKRGVQGCTLTL
jgi:hypothetical protein